VATIPAGGRCPASHHTIMQFYYALYAAELRILPTKVMRKQCIHCIQSLGRLGQNGGPLERPHFSLGGGPLVLRRTAPVSGTSLSRQSFALILTTNKKQTHKTKYCDPIQYVS